MKIDVVTIKDTIGIIEEEYDRRGDAPKVEEFIHLPIARALSNDERSVYGSGLRKHGKDLEDIQGATADYFGYLAKYYDKQVVTKQDVKDYIIPIFKGEELDDPDSTLNYVLKMVDEGKLVNEDDIIKEIKFRRVIEEDEAIFKKILKTIIEDVNQYLMKEDGGNRND